MGLSVALSLVCFALSLAVTPGGAVPAVAPRSVLEGVLRLDSGALGSLGVLVLLLSPLARLIGVGAQLHAEGRPRLAAGAALIAGLLVFSLGKLVLQGELPPRAPCRSRPRDRRAGSLARAG